MFTSDVYRQSFAAQKMKPRRLIDDLMNDLGYLYAYIRVTYLKQGEKNNTNSLILIKV